MPCSLQRALGNCGQERVHDCVVCVDVHLISAICVNSSSMCVRRLAIHSASQSTFIMVRTHLCAYATHGIHTRCEQVQKKIHQLSGGEKARVALCTFMLRPANLLVLDEPTNHLDIPAKEMVRGSAHASVCHVLRSASSFVSLPASHICTKRLKTIRPVHAATVHV